MKKFILLCLIFPCLTVCANEVVEDYLDIAASYCIHGQYTDAADYVNKILKLEPNNTEAIELKSTLTRIMNPAAQSYLSSNNLNIKQAFAAKKNGNKQAEFNALNAITDNFWGSYLLAQSYLDSNDFLQATVYFQKAAMLKPNFSQCYLGLAKSYISQRDYRNAITNIDKYLSYNRNSDIAYALRAEANLNLNLISEALSDIKKALNIENNLSYMFTEAKILYYKGDYDEAREKLNILSKNIQTSEVYKYLGLCDYAQSDYPNALLNLDKAIILSDEDKSIEATYNDIKSMLDKKKI